MADEIILNGDLNSAASAIEALLNPQPAQESASPSEINDAVRQTYGEMREQFNKKSPQAASESEAAPAPSASNDGAPQAPVEAAPQAPEPKPEPAKPAPQATPDVEQMRTEAAKKLQEAETARSQFLTQLNTYIPQLESALRGEFADIKTPEDVLKLAETDIPRYNRFQIQQMRLSQAYAARNQAAQVEQTQAQERFNQWRSQESEKIGTLIPELKDPERGPTLARKINQWALENGYTADQLSRASATDFAVLHKAMQADDLRAQIDKAKQKAAVAPPVQEPGVTQNKSSKETKIQTDYERLQRSGRVDDAAAVFKNFLN